MYCSVPDYTGCRPVGVGSRAAAADGATSTDRPFARYRPTIPVYIPPGSGPVAYIFGRYC